MNLLEINARIRQRPPFQMIERVTALEPGKSADMVMLGCDNIHILPYYVGMNCVKATISAGRIVAQNP